MERVAVNGTDLEFEVRGTGEPVLLVHAAIFADFFAPLLAQSRLTESYRLIHYHRVGYGAARARPVR